MSKPLLSVGRTVLPPAMFSLLVLFGLPPWAPMHMHTPNSRDPKTAMMDSILTLWSRTWEYYSTILTDSMYYVTIYNGMPEFMKHVSSNKGYISDEQLHAMQLCIYDGIKVQVEGMDGVHICQICRCTGSQSWRWGDQRNNWVWEKQCPGMCYVTQNGCIPCQLQRLFKIRLQNKDGAFVPYWLAVALTTIPANLGNLDPILKSVQLR